MDKSKWEYKKLGDVCEVLDSKRKPITKRNRISGMYPYYGASGIQDFVNSYIFDGRYLLVGEDGAKWGSKEKSSYIIEGKSWVNNHVHIISLNNEYIDSFIKYYLNFKDLTPYITGAVVPKLTQSALLNISIPWLKKKLQQQIVAELDQLNELISLKQQQLKEYDALAQSIFYEMFGDPMENDKNWTTTTYGEKFFISSGGTPSKSVKEYWEGGNIPWIGSNMCQNCILYETDGKFITTKGLYNSSTRLLPKGTILIALVGATIGKVALLECETTINQNIAYVLNDKKCDSYYLYYHTMGLYKLFLNVGNGKFKMANQKFIKGLPIMLPPLTLQQSFAERVGAIERQKALVKQSIAEVQTLLDSRMQEYFG